jgi:hypothetical protein
MLALGACDRVRKIAREWPRDLAESPVLTELIITVKDDPLSQLSGSCMAALSTISLHPDGRQIIFINGASQPLINLVKQGQLDHPNTDKAISLLMNLAADSVSRKQMREEGLVEVLVKIINTCPFEGHIMEHCLGTLHNVMLTDSRAKRRAVDANIAEGIARILSARLQPEGCLINVRLNMIISDLLAIQDLQDLVNDAAKSKGWKIPAPSAYRKGQAAANHESPSSNISQGGPQEGIDSPSKAGTKLNALPSKKDSLGTVRSMKTQHSLTNAQEEEEGGVAVLLEDDV